MRLFYPDSGEGILCRSLKRIECFPGILGPIRAAAHRSGKRKEANGALVTTRYLTDCRTNWPVPCERAGGEYRVKAHIVEWDAV